MSNDDTTATTPTKSESRTAREKRVVGVWKAKLGSNPTWASRGLLAIYKYQTETEKMTDSVSVNNGVGFAGTDGEFLSSLAKQLLSRGSLSPKQMTFLHKKMPKYAKQLWKAAGGPG
jgi:hypothetical protein